MTAPAAPFDRAEERNLLGDWLTTVAFDDPPAGIPALQPDDGDDDGEALTASAYDDEHHVKRDNHGKFAHEAGAAVDKAVGGVEKAVHDAKVGDVGKGPLTDEQFAARQKMVENVIGEARKTLSTDITHATDGAWDPERDKIHRQIAKDLYAAAAHVPNDGKSVIAGGLGGAGKSTVLRDFAGIDAKNYLTVNPDDIKEVMAAKGLVPDVPGHPDLSPMERAALIHEESSRIGLMLADMAYRDRKNMIWDVTMSSEGSARSRINALKNAGYTDVKGVFVDIPVEVSVTRAMSRYRRGVDQYLAGKGPGGRFVPPGIIRAQRTSSGQTINRTVFDKLRSDFTHWSMYDNSVDGRAPQLISESKAAALVAAARSKQVVAVAGGSVGQLLDDLAAGRVTVADVAADFAARTWPRIPEATAAQAWGVADDPAPAPDSWAIVNADSRLTAAQYQTLAAAYRSAAQQPAPRETGLIAVDDTGRPLVAATALHLQGVHDQATHGNRFAAPPAVDPAAGPAVVPAAPVEHTGAMIALIPSDADAQRLAVDGGEPPEELHCTLAYLGDDATQIPADVRQAIIAGLTECLTGWPAVQADGFAVSVFNPGDANDLEPCIALGLSGADLQHVHGIVEETLMGVADDQVDDPGEYPVPPVTDPGAPVYAPGDTPAVDPAVDPGAVDPEAGGGWVLPDQHVPWIPHVTLTWAVDPTQVADLVDRVGPIVFDRVRVAFGGENTDFPLAAEPDMPGDGPHPDDVTTAASGGAWLSRMPEALKAYWIRHLAPWGHGTFARCVKGLARYYPKDPEGTCANLHKEATGRWPGQDHSARTEITMASPTTPTPAATPAAPGGASPCPDGQHPDDSGTCVPDEPVVPATAPKTPPAAAAAPGTPAVPGPAPAGPAPAAPAGDNPCPDGQHPDESGTCVPDEPSMAAKTEHFHAIMHVEGVSTGMRTFVPGALDWRTPPFAFHWQRNSSAHGGMPETVQVGNVLRAERDPANESAIHGWGNLDLDSPEGLDYARRLANGFSGWVSIGLDESPVEVELVWPEGGDPENPEDIDGAGGLLFAEPEQEIYHSGRIGELTAVSVPAQAEATIEPTPALLEELAARGVVMVASAVAVHGTATSADTWDGAAAEKALPDPLPVAVAKNEYAWIDDSAVDGDNIPKSGCKFPHHDVGADGQPGPANLAACSAVIAALHGGRGGADIPDSDRQGVYDHVAKHLTDGGQTPPALAVPIVAAGHIIEIPNVPPAWWFARPTDVTPHGALTITDEGRVYGYLAPAGVRHRAFLDRKVTVPMGRVDYSRWMGGEALVAGGGRVVAGPITMECGHLPPSASSRSVIRMEHYDNACSVVAKACIGEDAHGVWIAGALEPHVTADQVSRMLACQLSGDWAPHPDRPGWTDFVAALIVPSAGFPQSRSAPSVRVAGGALVASAVPVRFEHHRNHGGPDLGPVLERVARSIGRDRASRLEQLRHRVHGGG